MILWARAVLIIWALELVLLWPDARKLAMDFQTLATGILAVVAARIAFKGALAAASVQAEAGHRQAEATTGAIRAQLDAEDRRTQEDRQRECAGFYNAMMMSIHSLRTTIRIRESTLEEIRQRKDAFDPLDIAYLKIPIPPILESRWDDLVLLEIDLMQKVVQLQNFLSEINANVDLGTAVLREDTVNLKKYFENTGNMYAFALGYIEAIVPEKEFTEELRRLHEAQ